LIKIRQQKQTLHMKIYMHICTHHQHNLLNIYWSKNTGILNKSCRENEKQILCVQYSLPNVYILLDGLTKVIFILCVEAITEQTCHICYTVHSFLKLFNIHVV
jgi:hypothetical protein